MARGGQCSTVSAGLSPPQKAQQGCTAKNACFRVRDCPIRHLTPELSRTALRPWQKQYCHGLPRPRSGLGLNELLAWSLAKNVCLHARCGVQPQRSSRKFVHRRSAAVLGCTESVAKVTRLVHRAASNTGIAQFNCEKTTRRSANA